MCVSRPVVCVCVSCLTWALFTRCFFFFKQKTAYEMRISDWSSDVCSSDLLPLRAGAQVVRDLIIGDALQVQRDPHAIGAGRAPIAVERRRAHRAGAIMARHSPKPMDT